MGEKLVLIAVIALGLVLLVGLLRRGGQPRRREEKTGSFGGIAERIFGSPAAGVSSQDLLWARQELLKQGISPMETPAAAMNTLRSARPGLSIGASKALVDALRTTA